MFHAPGVKVSPARDGPQLGDTEPFASYRGPLVDSVRTEEVDTPPSPFHRLMEGDIGFPELRALADEILGNEPGGEALLPRAAANEDTATYETTESEFEEWVRKMDQQRPDDDPPDGDVPDSQVWRRDDEDEQEGGSADLLAA